MIIAAALSKNNVPIRLTDERWEHIILTHQEVDNGDFNRFMRVISDPELIFKGSKGELLAIQKVSGKRLWIVVPYKEITKKDGFVLTAYFTSDLTWLFKKEIIWNKH